MDCVICKHPRIVGINNDLLRGYPFHKLCTRNNIEYSTEIGKALLEHRISHIQSPAMAMAQSMMYEEAVNLKNTAIEINLSIDQIDIAMIDILDTIEVTDDIEVKHKLYKNYTDFMRRKVELIAMLNKLSGKDLKEDVIKASLVEMVKTVSKEVGTKKVNEIKKGINRNSNIEKFLMQDEYLNSLFDELKDDNQAYEVESDED